MHADQLKSLLERLSLVDLKEEPEEGDDDKAAGLLRAELTDLYTRALVSVGRPSGTYKHQGFQTKFLETGVELVFETGEKYSVSYQRDSEIIHVIRLDTLRVASPEVRAEVDRALGLATVSLRLPKADYEVLEAEARRQGLIPQAFLRQVLLQEVEALRGATTVYEVIGAGNV